MLFAADVFCGIVSHAYQCRGTRQVADVHDPQLLNDVALDAVRSSRCVADKALVSD